MLYLFVDGIAERIRPGQRREPVLAAWGFTAGRLPCGFLHTMACDLFTRLELPVSGRRPPSSISGEG